MTKILFDDDDAPSGLQVNQQFAKKYEEKKKHEELSQRNNSAYTFES